MSKRGYFRAFSKSFKKIVVGLADFVRKFQTIIRIFVLLSGLGAFSVVGGLLFQVVESPREQLSIAVTKDVRERTLEAIYTIFASGSSSTRRDLTSYGVQMLEYERNYIRAIKNGTTFIDGKPNPLWTFEGSTYFCVTTFAQLGFGNLSPKSLLGRFVSILYACFSIPFGAIVFADLGDQINKLITVSYSVFYNFFKTVKEAADEDIEKYEKLKMGMKQLSKKAKKKAEQKEKEKKGLIRAVRRLANLNARIRAGDPTKTDLEDIEFEEDENNNQNNKHEQFIPHRGQIYTDCNNFFSSVKHAILNTRLRRRKTNHIGEKMNSLTSCYNNIENKSHPSSTFTKSRKDKAVNAGRAINIDCRKTKSEASQKSLQNKKMKKTVSDLFEFLTWSPACPLIVRIAHFRNKLSERLRERGVSLGNVKKQKTKKENHLTKMEFNNSNLGGGGGGGDESDDEEEEEEEGSDIIDDMNGEQVPVVIITILLVIAYVVLGVYITTLFEKWNYTEAAWFLIMSVLTVGYGDVTPHNEVFFACFVGYLILGMALCSNVINMSMKFLTTVTTQLSSIAKDMYTTANARSNFHNIRRNGLRARRWWFVVRHHVMSGLPQTLVEESRSRKRRLIESEKDLIKRAFRIYYEMQFEQRLQKHLANESKMKCADAWKPIQSLRDEPAQSMREVERGQSMSGAVVFRHEPSFKRAMMVDASTQTDSRITRWQRIKRGVKRKYENFRNALAPGADYL